MTSTSTSSPRSVFRWPMSDNPPESPSGGRWQLDRIVAELRLSREETHSIRRDGEARRAPSREALQAILDGLTEALFPRHYGQFDLDGENIDYFVGNRLSIALDGLCDQIHRGARFVGDELIPGYRREDAVELTRQFGERLPVVRGLLISDLRAAFVGDPAARNFPEILIGYPGMTAIIHHRLAQAGLPQQSLFSDAVIQRVHEYSEGIPRLVNSICDASLQTGFALHSPEVTIAIVDEVAKDLDLRRLVPRGLEPLEPMEPVMVAPPPPVIRQTNGHAADFTDGLSNGNGYHPTRSTESRVPPTEKRVPLESYASRKKTLSFFAQLMDRWK